MAGSDLHMICICVPLPRPLPLPLYVTAQLYPPAPIFSYAQITCDQSIELCGAPPPPPPPPPPPTPLYLVGRGRGVLVHLDLQVDDRLLPIPTASLPVLEDSDGAPSLPRHTRGRLLLSIQPSIGQLVHYFCNCVYFRSILFDTWKIST